AIVSPALPAEIIDPVASAQTSGSATALRRDAASWRVPLPAGSLRQLRIRLDAALAVDGHSGAIRWSGVHPAEGGDAPFRWTGPDATSTITIPAALNLPALLTIELGSTGRNRAAEDFTIACNGRTVEHRLGSVGPQTMLSAYLPASRFAVPATEISLTVR